MPTRKGRPSPGPPAAAISPAALTSTPQMPRPPNAARACCAAQPLTYPDGSNPPGTAQGSNQPPDRSRATAQRSSTSATSGGACALVISPRRSRLTGLSGRQVLKVSSARCKMATASASCLPSCSLSWPPGSAVA